jgi:hypothetical protein
MTARRSYAYTVKVTDSTPGWTLGTSRLVPRGYSVYVFLPGSGIVLNLLDDKTIVDVSTAWLELEVVSTSTEPPRCVALRAPGGISTAELRFPLAGLVTEATAQIATKDGTFTDSAYGIEYEDMLFEASRTRGRKRTRTAVTAERLDEVASVAAQNPRKPTAAVQHRFGGISRGYARKLIKLAEARSDGETR